MKKWFVMLLMAGLVAPAWAECSGEYPHKDGRAAVKDAKRAEMRKIHKERDAQFKKTKEQVEKLVQEYKKAKPGSKKAAQKKAEIAKLVAQVREDQFKFKRELLDNFKARLDVMEQELAAAQDENTKAAWVDEKTDAVINDNGDLKVLFQDKLLPPPPGPRKGHFKKGPRPGEAAKDPHGADMPKDGPMPLGPDGEILPPPPAPEER